MTVLSRREFLRTLGRRVLLGSLAAFGGALAARHWSESCRRSARCEGCPELARCDLPPALDRRASQTPRLGSAPPGSDPRSPTWEVSPRDRGAPPGGDLRSPTWEAPPGGDLWVPNLRAGTPSGRPADHE